MTTTTLPAFTRSSRKRTVTFRFVTKVDGFKSKGVDVTVSQFEGWKRMSAVAHVTTVETEPGAVFSSTSFYPFHGVSLGQKAAGRFSQKNLEAFADEVLARLPEALEASPAFAAMFDPDWEA